MIIEFTGKVVAVLPLQSGMGQRGPWSRATVAFEVQDGRYTRKIACENTNDAQKFASLKVGQEVHVKADVTSREYQGKWYTTAVCFEFSSPQAQQPQYSAPPASTEGEPF